MSATQPPTLAFLDTRALCVDVAALWAGTHASLAWPAASLRDGDAHVHLDEEARVQLRLTLPPLPSLPAPATDAPVTTWDGATALPPLLRTLLSSLRISLQGDDATRRAYVWDGRAPPSAFGLHDADEPWAPAPATRPTPLADAALSGGVRYDAARAVWTAEWTCDVALPSSAAPTPGTPWRLEATWSLHLDVARLILEDAPHADAAPFRYTSQDTSVFQSGTDPYMLDVDVLSALSDGVQLPDETPAQRHRDLAGRLTLLPLSALAQTALGHDIVAPWKEAQALAQRVRDMRALESEARGADQDITMAALGDVPTAHAARDQPRAPRGVGAALGADLGTLLTSGAVVLCRTSVAEAHVVSSVSVRMRTLPRAMPVATPGSDEAMGLLVSVELENASRTHAFDVHALDVHVGEAADHAAPPPTPSSVQAVVAPLLGPALAMPLRLAPMSQHHVVYTVRIECPFLEAPDAERALADWAPRRATHVVLRGTPVRDTMPKDSTCRSEWRGVVDLSLALLHEQRRVAAAHVMLRATGALQSVPPRPAAPVVAGTAALGASALAAHAAAAAPVPPPKPWRTGAPAPSAPAAPTRTTTVAAPAWPHTYASPLAVALDRASAYAGQGDAADRATPLVRARAALPWRAPGAERERAAPSGAALLVSVDTQRAASEAGMVVLRVSLLNVAPHDVDVEIEWADDGSGTLRAESHKVHVGYVKRTDTGGSSPRYRATWASSCMRCSLDTMRLASSWSATPRRTAPVCSSSWGMCI